MTSFGVIQSTAVLSVTPNVSLSAEGWATANSSISAGATARKHTPQPSRKTQTKRWPPF